MDGVRGVVLAGLAAVEVAAGQPRPAVEETGDGPSLPTEVPPPVVPVDYSKLIVIGVGLAVLLVVVLAGVVWWARSRRRRRPSSRST